MPSNPRFSRRGGMLSALAGAAVTSCSPAGLLNQVSRLAGDPARLAVDGARFGDDPRQRLDVWLPSGGAGRRGPLPTVVFFYGGSWTSGARGDYGFVGRAFAARGFAAVIPDYRLAPAARFPAFLDDGAAALAWTARNIAELGGDPGAILLSGHSAGAYNAAMLALDRRYLERAGADPAMIRAAALLSGPYDFRPWVSVFGSQASAPETLPVRFARRDAPPMLLMHGTADRTVLPYNSERLAAALTRAGAAAELKLYAGKGHVDTIKSLSPLYRRTTPALADSVAFLRTHAIA